MRFAGLVLPGLGSGGNRTTALRWARHLRALGWRTFVETEWSGRPCDLLVALHARKSLPSIRRFRERYPRRPLVVAATGTDLYEDLAAGGERARAARSGFAAADRIVVLQERALEALPAELRARARVVHQSMPAPSERPDPVDDAFEVVVLANLRAVKDPFVVAEAARLLPATSRVRVVHLGAPLDESLVARAEREARENPRWRWLGPRPRREALQVLARARLLVVPSRAEGGANVVTEGLAAGIPIVASDVPGSTGLVGEDHPGLFPPGDAAALAALLRRAEEDPAFLEQLAARSRARAWIADPEREREAWRALLAELVPDASNLEAAP